MALRGPRIEPVKAGIHDPVEAHGRRAGADHGNQYPEKSPKRDLMAAMRQDHRGKGKGQGKDRMAEFDHAAEIHDLAGQGGCGSGSCGSAGFQKIPGADALLQVVEKRIQQDPEKAHGDDADKHLHIIKAAPGIHDVKAQSGCGGKGFHEKQHGNAGSGADAKGGKALGERGRNHDMVKGLKPAAAKGPEGLNVFFIQPQHAVARGHHDLIAHDQGDHEDFRGIPQPEENQENGKQHDLGDRIG